MMRFCTRQQNWMMMKEGNEEVIINRKSTRVKEGKRGEGKSVSEGESRYMALSSHCNDEVL